MKRPPTKSITRWPVVAWSLNLLLVYALFSLTRLVFYASNAALYADHIDCTYLWELMLAGLRFDTSAIFYLNLPLLVLFLLPLRVKECTGTYRLGRFLFVVLNGVGLAANLGDCGYYAFSGRRTTWSVVQEFSHESSLLGILLKEMAPYWYLFLIGLLCFWLLYKCYQQPDTKQIARQGKWSYYIVQAAAFLGFATLAVGGMRGGWTTAVRPITLSNANQYVRQAADAGIVLNTPFCLIRTINKTPFKAVRYMPEAEATKLFSPLHTPEQGTTFQPRNVVVFILESFGRQAEEQGFMPFVDSLAHAGRSFRYSYANGRKSIDGMPSVLSSIPCFVEPFFLTPAALNDLSGLAGELTRHKGYTSAFFHGAENGSMGFQAFARSTGFQQYHGRTEYNADPARGGDRDFDGTWAIWDEEFLQYMADRLGTMKQPFVASVFTASSHSPFKVPERYAGQFRKGSQPVMEAIGYSDMALRRFFEKARTQPWFANTLFVLTADHTNQHDLPHYTTDLGLYAVPLIFYAPSLPALKGVDEERVVSQTDIMPTVLGLLGYDRPYIAFGQDALRTPPEQTFAANYLTGSDLYQFVRGEWLLQFDGQKVVHAYRYRTDSLLRHDLAGKHPDAYERQLQSLIQQYMERMNGNRLVVEKEEIGKCEN